MSRIQIKALVLSLVLITLGCVSCSTDDEVDIVDPPRFEEVSMADGLAGYWSTNENITSGMLTLNVLLTQIESALTAKGRLSKDVTSDVDTLVTQYLAQAQTVSDNLDSLIALEEDIQPYGNKGAFSETASSVITDVYSDVQDAALASGQMLRTSWRILSGTYTIRDGLREEDSGTPVISTLSERIQDHYVTRDQLILASIEAGDSQGDLIPLDDLEGDTAAAQAEYYRGLADADDLKMAIRGAVHLWNDSEKTATAATLVAAAQECIKMYGDASTGSDALTEITEQLVSFNQDSGTSVTVQTAITDADNDIGVTASTLMIIRKLYQPDNEPRLVILAGIDSSFDLDLPLGVYDVVTIAEDYIRTVVSELEPTPTDKNDLALEMYQVEGNEIVLEGIEVVTEDFQFGDRLSLIAEAASTVGNLLEFVWEVEGEYTAYTYHRAGISFRPTAPGTNTISVTVTDPELEVSKTFSTTYTVIAPDIYVSSYTVTEEQFEDNVINPGETVTLSLRVLNNTDSVMRGDISLTGQDQITVTEGAVTDTTVAANSYRSLPFVVEIPSDYGGQEGTFEFQFSNDEVEINQTLTFDVNFYARISTITSPVTSRVLELTGIVSHPTLETARLVISRDIDQLFTLNLDNGAFTQQVAVESSDEMVSHTVHLVGETAGRFAEYQTSFTSLIPLAGFRVTLTWDTNRTDIDLWTTDPAGEKCYYANGLTETDLELDFDDVDGYGPENITAVEPISGDYFVQLHYYADHSKDGTPTNCTVTIRLNEGSDDYQITNYYGLLSDVNDIWDVATVSFDKSKGIYTMQENGSHSIASPASLPVK